LTRSGYGALGVGAALSAIGMICRWVPVAVLGAGLILLVAGSYAYVLRRPRLEMGRRIEPARVEKGRPALGVVEVVNLSRRSLAPIAFEQKLGLLTVQASLPPLRPGQSWRGTYRLPTSVRGNYDVGPMELPRADPFGLCRTVQTIGAPQRLSVLPRVLHLRPLPTGVSRNLEGPSSDSSPQGSVTFHRLREYAVGDDLRNIHWPTTARAGHLVVRHNVDTAQPHTVVLLDLDPAHYRDGAGKLEEAVDVAASVSVSLAASRAPVQLRTTGGERVGGATYSDPAAIVDYLTDVGPQESGGLEAELVKLRRDRGGTALVVITGHLDFNLLPGIAGLRRRFDRVIVVSLADRGSRPPVHPGVAVIGAATAEEVARCWNGGASR
jgi:uncharacterized protein (DUF58 family)